MTTRDEPAFNDRFSTDSLLGLTAPASPGHRKPQRAGQLPGARARSPGAGRSTAAGRRGAAPPRRRSGLRSSPRRLRLRLSLILTAMNGWPRWALALMCALGAAVTGAHQPSAHIASGDHGGPVGQVLVAAQDLAAGATLSGRNVRLAAVPADVVPDGAVGSLAAGAGRVVAAPVRRGEPITDARLLGPGLATGLSPPETRAVPVRLADGQTASLLRPGDRIDLLATPVDAGLGAVPASAAGTSSDQRPNSPSARSGPGSPAGAGPTGGNAPAGTAEQTADRMVTATLLASGVRVLAVLVQDGTNLTDGVLVVVAASDRTARQLAAAGAQQRLSVAIRPP